MAIFGLKPRVNSLRKMSIFRLFELLVFIAQKSIFFVLEYLKRHFPGLNCQKKKVEKMAIFRPKPWVNPFRKMSIFRLFELFLFIAKKDIFFVLEYCKRHVPGLYCPKKKQLEKQPFLNQNRGLTPLEICQFIELLTSLFLQPKKAFFRSRIS